MSSFWVDRADGGGEILYFNEFRGKVGVKSRQRPTPSPHSCHPPPLEPPMPPPLPTLQGDTFSKLEPIYSCTIAQFSLLPPQKNHPIRPMFPTKSWHLDVVEEGTPGWQGLLAIVRDGVETDGVVHGHLAVALMSVNWIAVEILATFRALVFPTIRICARDRMVHFKR